MVRRGMGFGHGIKVMVSDERCMDIEVQGEGRAVRVRSIYLRPQGSRRLESDDLMTFEGNTMVSGDISWCGTAHL